MTDHAMPNKLKEPNASKVTTHPREKDNLFNYPVRIDGVVVGWGRVRRERFCNRTRFIFHPLSGNSTAFPYDFKADGWIFQDVEDLKARLVDVLAGA